jgi:hypothetical protein
MLASSRFTLSFARRVHVSQSTRERPMTVWTRIKLAFAACFTILFKGRLPTALQPAARVEAPSQPIAADTHDRAVQMLALLQREGRLIDFVLEDLTAYSDAQIGAAARDVHAGCHRVLERYVTLEAILPGREGEAVTVGQDRQIDPAAFHLVGNVAGQPPFRGTLLHPGWRASRVHLPPLGTTGRAIVAPAEIELT